MRHFCLSIKTLLLSTIVLSATFFYNSTALAIDIFPGKEASTIGLETEDLIVHQMDDEFYAEAWYFMGQMLDGTQVFIHYGISNAGFGDFTGAIEATIIDKDGEVTFEKTTIKKKYITYDPKTLDISFDKKHTLKGTPNQFHITSQGDKISFDLVVTPHVPGVKFGDGATWFDEDKKEFYKLVVLTPKGHIEGKINFRGQEASVKGYAYGDHSWQNYPAHKMADRLFSMRGFDSDSSAAFLLFRTADFDIPTLVLSEGKNIILATTQLDVKESKHKQDDSIKKYQIAEQLDISGKQGGPQVSGTINFSKRLMRQDPVKEFNFLERTVIKMFVAKPILYRYNNDYEFTLPNGDAPKSFKGNGVVEAMILRVE